MTSGNQSLGLEAILEQTDWQKVDGLLPAIIQDAKTNQVLMEGFMNREALQKTLELKKVTFFSRTKQRLWTKGEQSGNVLNFLSAQLDCDQDCLLIKADPVGPTCHTGATSCFDREIGASADSNSSIEFLNELSQLINERHKTMPEGSYTTSLFNKGIRKIAQKVGEEGVEIALAAVDEDDKSFLGEAADLVFHTLVLLEARGKNLTDVIEVLKERHGK